MAKRILTKEKIDRQLVGQSTSTTPFMKVSEGYHTNNKAVSFVMQDSLDAKIDKLMSMMSKLTAQGDKQDKQFKPKIYQGKKRGQIKHNYDQSSYQTRNRSISGDKRMSFRDRCRGRYEQNYGQNYRQNYRGRREDNYKNYFRRGNIRETQNYRGQNYRSGHRDNYRMTTEILTETTIEMTIEMTILEEVEVGLGKENIHVMSEGVT